MRQTGDRRITIAILFSILLHLVMLYFLVHPLQRSASAPKELELVLSEGMQIADITPPEVEKRPEKARFLGLYDSQVDEEQVASTPYIAPSARRIMTTPEGRELSSKEADREGTRYAAKIPEKGVRERGDEEELGSVLPEDFFPNIKVRDHTYLNVLRYPEIGYFVRLKKIFKLTWDPHPVLAHYFFMNQVTSARVESTVLFQIDRKGNLKRAFVYRTSGLPLYDQEALRVVQDSAPFAVPPAELMKMDGNDDGELDVLFTFTVYQS
ncbi:MAG: TonB C-terminal domain-containing protein [Deltaproteobacteria bacterium]|nr:TonB C-terminal domain-containing protein [Deltaproteobacteria bacterium]MBI4373343.1 TonB C-terminal domain-containing protein [Deltaproteobacteria bacterium]